ncbi:MAG: DMT family transporter [Anaerolineae bacterium]|nr:DMT family transporter [Anaerolineae bacterium]
MQKAYIKYILALLLFGSNGIVASLITLSSYEIVFLRSFIGSLFLIIIFILSGRKIQSWKNKKHFVFLIISGVAMGASWMFLFEAYVQIGVGLSTLAYYCGPAIVMILAPFIFGESLSRIKWAGFFAVLTGMFLLNLQSILLGQLSWGLVCGLGAAAMYAVMIIFNKKATSITGLENPMFQLTVSFLTVGLFILLKQGALINLTMQNIFPVLFLGIINTGIGCYLYFSSVTQLPAQSVVILSYLDPLSALIFSAIFLGERLSMVQLIGTLLILGGAALGEYFSRKRLNAV